MLNDFIQEVKTRIESGLSHDQKVLLDVKTVSTNSLPVVFLEIDSGVPDLNYRHSKKYKLTVKFSLLVYSEALSDLLDLIEELESAMNLCVEFSSSINLTYYGWNREAVDIGSSIYAGKMSFSSDLIKTV